MKSVSLSIKDAEFITFCRDIFQGRLPESYNSVKTKWNRPSSSVLKLLARDLTRTCLGFILESGGVLPVTHVSKSDGRTSIQHSTFVVTAEGENIQFRFSGFWIDFLDALYFNNPIPTLNHETTIADSIAYTAFLNRFSDSSGSTLLGRWLSGHTKEINNIVSLMPLARLCFIDRINTGEQAFSPLQEKEFPFFLDLVAFMSPFIAEQWLKIDTGLLCEETPVNRVIEVCRFKAIIVKELVAICRKQGRMEPLVFLSRLAGATLRQNFYDPDRPFSRMLYRLDMEIENAMDNGPGFCEFFQHRGAYPPQYTPVASILDSIASSPETIWWSAADIFRFIFKLPTEQVDHDLGTLSKGDSAGLLLVKEYMVTIAGYYLKQYFHEILKPLVERLNDRISIINSEKKKMVQSLSAAITTKDQINGSNAAEIFALWLLIRRLKVHMEDQSSGTDNTDEKNALWAERRLAEEAIEQEMARIFENRSDNIIDWVNNAQLETNRELQELAQAVLDGMIFVEELQKLSEEADLLSFYDEEESARRAVAMWVLDFMGSDAEERQALFSRYRSLKEILGYVL